MNHELLQAYVQALLPERERYLHQHALNKARVITRSMRPAEKEAYLKEYMGWTDKPPTEMAQISSDGEDQPF